MHNKQRGTVGGVRGTDSCYFSCFLSSRLSLCVTRLPSNPLVLYIIVSSTNIHNNIEKQVKTNSKPRLNVGLEPSNYEVNNIRLRVISSIIIVYFYVLIRICIRILKQYLSWFLNLQMVLCPKLKI